MQSPTPPPSPSRPPEERLTPSPIESLMVRAAMMCHAVGVGVPAGLVAAGEPPVRRAR